LNYLLFLMLFFTLSGLLEIKSRHFRLLPQRFTQVILYNNILTVMIILITIIIAIIIIIILVVIIIIIIIIKNVVENSYLNILFN